MTAILKFITGSLLLTIGILILYILGDWVNSLFGMDKNPGLDIIAGAGLVAGALMFGYLSWLIGSLISIKGIKEHFDLKCPECGSKMHSEYNAKYDKLVWKCTKCDKRWI